MAVPASRLSTWAARISDYLVPFEREDLYQARQELSPLFKGDEAWHAHMLLGNAYSRLGLVGEAISELRIALVKGVPARRLSLVKYNLASALTVAEEHEEAERLLREIADDEVREVDVYAVLAHALFGQGKLSEAHTAFLRGATHSRADEFGALLRLATSAAQIDLPLEAVELLARMALALEARQSDEPALSVIDATRHPGFLHFVHTHGFAGALATARVLARLPPSPALAPLFLSTRDGTFELPAVELVHERLMLLRAVKWLNLPPSWDGERARVPSMEAFGAAQELVGYLARAGLVAHRVLADVEGGIGFDFHASVDEQGTPHRYASFLCDNDGDILLLFRALGERPRARQIDRVPEQLGAAVDEAIRFLENS